jgi:hypothetical protein
MDVPPNVKKEGVDAVSQEAFGQPVRQRKSLFVVVLARKAGWILTLGQLRGGGGSDTPSPQAIPASLNDLDQPAHSRFCRQVVQPIAPLRPQVSIPVSLSRARLSSEFRLSKASWQSSGIVDCLKNWFQQNRNP